MRFLTFHFVGFNGAALSFDLRPCQTADEALDLLKGMFAEHRSCQAVEIFDGDALLLRAERPASDAAPRGPAV